MSMGIPPSASTSIFGSSLLARPDAKLVVRYCASPPLSMSRSLGGMGGGGRSFLYLVETTMSCLKPPLTSPEAAIFRNYVFRKIGFNWQSSPSAQKAGRNLGRMLRPDCPWGGLRIVQERGLDEDSAAACTRIGNRIVCQAGLLLYQGCWSVWMPGASAGFIYVVWQHTLYNHSLELESYLSWRHVTTYYHTTEDHSSSVRLLAQDSRSSLWAKLQRRFPGCPLLPSLEATFISSCGGIRSHCFGFRHCGIWTHRIVIMSGTFCHCFSARHTHARRHQSVTITRIQLLARSQPFARRTL
jgi:hypothetical protein